MALLSTRAEILSTVRIIKNERFDSPKHSRTQNYKQCMVAARENFYFSGS